MKSKNLPSRPAAAFSKRKPRPGAAGGLVLDEAPRPFAGAELSNRIPSLVSLWRSEEIRSEAADRGESLCESPLMPQELRKVANALLALQRGLTGRRELPGLPYMESPELLGAYLLYYWPVSYLQASLALAELGARPKKVLDLGSGPGPFAAALQDAGADELLLVDSSPRALSLARNLLDPREHARAGSKNRATRIETLALDLESSAALPDGPFDLVSMGHCLNELWRDRSASERFDLRLALLKAAIKKLSPGGTLLVLEPALLSTAGEALALRDALAAHGHAIAGPCPGSYPCPALAAGPDRSCHSEAEWFPPEPIASIARAAGLDRRSVKATWFAVSRDSSTQEKAAYATDTSTKPSDSTSSSGTSPLRLPRVVSDPMLNKAGRLRFILCSEGRLVTISAPLDDERARAMGFRSLRRGDRVLIDNAEKRETGSLGIGPKTSFSIAARSPIPALRLAQPGLAKRGTHG